MTTPIVIQDLEEAVILRRMLEAPLIIGSLTVAEMQAVYRLREKVGLPSMPEIDDYFVRRYTNCFRGCEG